MILLIELSLLVVTGILILHASHHYNWSFVKVFWISGAVMGLFREYALVGILKLYGYGDFHLTFFGVPLFYLVFWSNLAYIGLIWSNNYLGREYLKAEPLDYHLPLIFFTQVLIAFAIEAFLSQYQLVNWQVDSSSLSLGATPLLAPFAYGWTAVLFVKSLKILSRQNKQNWRSLLIKLSLSQAPVVIILAGLLLLSNLSIILVFS